MKVLLVDDSFLVRSILKRLIDTWENFEVVGEAKNGKEAINAVETLKPDILLMDVNMPIMDGIEATAHIMKKNPLPIVILTNEDIAEVGYKALNEGAMEVVPKPNITMMNDPEFTNGFKTILKHVSRFGQFKINREPTKEFSPQDAPSITSEKEKRRSAKKDLNLLVMGASTGGPSTVKTILAALPADFPIGILLSQHIEPGFDQGYADWLNSGTPLKVKLANESDRIIPGTVLVAPSDRHLICSTEGRVICDDGPKVGNQRPSVDKMFISASKIYKTKLLSVLLTGMGKDGADGSLQIKEAGGTTLVQDKESSLIFGMPKAAIELGAATEVLPLNRMAIRIKELLGI